MNSIINQIENLQWKFPRENKFIPLRNCRDYQLNLIKAVVRGNKRTHSTWFAISADKWFNDCTYLLKYRKKNREIKKQLGH